MRTFLLSVTACICALQAIAQETIIQYLSGIDKDHTVTWDFLCTRGRRSGVWSKIPVPSNWELQGFGTFNYYLDKDNPDEQGLYKHRFNLASYPTRKRVWLVFDAAMTDAEVRINGKSAGPVHRGGFYQFKYDITDLVQTGGSNLLEVTVSKHSSNYSINQAERKADFWLFGGIFRPVYVEIVPEVFIERVALDARANGDFSLQVFSNTKAGQVIEAQVSDLAGKPIDKPFSLLPGDSMLRHHFDGVRTWDPERPNLYYVTVSVLEHGRVLHKIRQRFGFRTVELRKADGIYVNDKKIIFKGVCRHSEWPESGRTLSRSVHLMDIRAIKGMNMNAVRMSHYPPDKMFLDLCDSLGLFVLDELTGWQAAYDTLEGERLVKELVVRDVNHACVVLWDNGNEGGWNRVLDKEYAWYDPQKRHVIHPWERFDGTNTKHYPDFKYIQNEVAHGKEVFFPTEFMHGLFDGGHGAGLEDCWNEMMKHPHAAGGFLWSLHDEGVVRADRGDSIDVAGNSAPDGIVGPHREREGSYYTIRELWSPVCVDKNGWSAKDPGTIPVSNKYIYTDLDKCRFEWELLHFPRAVDAGVLPKVLRHGSLRGPSMAPGGSGALHLPLGGTAGADALWLTAFNVRGDTVCTWSWTLGDPAIITGPSSIPVRGAIAPAESSASLVVTCDGIAYHFDKGTGFLIKVVKGGTVISFGGGPALAGSHVVLKEFRHAAGDNDYIVEPSYEGDSLRVKWTFHPGRLPKLEYRYLERDTAELYGITFDYPEERIKGMRWLGRGPYRVWKNRLAGQQIGVWQKAYNNTITGESWKYPEFKGWHSEMRWVQVQNKESNFIVYTDRAGIFLEMGKPERPLAAANDHTSPAFPEGNIGFMHAISPIGTKFQKAELMGPQSGRNTRQGDGVLTGVLYFDFR